MKHKRTIHPMFAQFVPLRKDEIKEHLLLTAFKRGVAGKNQYDELTRMVNNIMIIGLMQEDRHAIKQADELKLLVTEIYNRYKVKKSFVLNAEILDTLTALVTQYDGFIKSQPKDVLNRAKLEQALFENELHKKMAME